MKISKITLGLASVLVAGSLVFTSCRKKTTVKDEPIDNEQGTTADNHLAEGSANDVLSMGSQLSENNGSLTTFKATQNEALFALAGATIIAGSPVGTPPTVLTYTVDFGATGILGSDGRTRTGKLFFDFSGSTNNAKRYRNPGFKMVVSSSNYFVDGNAVNITKTVTNTSPLSVIGETAFSTNLTWAITANVSIVKASSGGTVNWSCSRTKELINTNEAACYGGQGIAIDWTKAKVKLNGNANGVNNKGENFTVVATDLVKFFTCAPGTNPHRHPFVSGTILYTPGSRPARLIDYGNGACDFNATVTIKGQTYAITLN
jgi:hypothetical protein